MMRKPDPQTVMQMVTTTGAALLVVIAISVRFTHLENTSQERGPRLDRIEERIVTLDRKVASLSAALLQAGAIRTLPVVSVEPGPRLEPAFAVQPLGHPSIAIAPFPRLSLIQEPLIRSSSPSHFTK